jgi:hypothetical protein
MPDRTIGIGDNDVVLLQTLADLTRQTAIVALNGDDAVDTLICATQSSADAEATSADTTSTAQSIKRKGIFCMATPLQKSKKFG